MRASVPTKPTSDHPLPGVSDERRQWVADSIPRRPAIDWRELAITGMHHGGALKLARRVSQSFDFGRTARSVFPRAYRARLPRFVILCYHGIGESGNPLIPSPTRDQFDAQMRFLKKNYRVLSLDALFHEFSQPASLDPAVAITFDDGYRSTYTQALPVLKTYQLPATVYLIVEPTETGEVAWYDRVFAALAHAPDGEFQVDLEGLRRFQLRSAESRLRSALELVAFLRDLPNARRQQCCRQLEKDFKLSPAAVSGKILGWDEIRIMQKSGIAFGSHTMTHPVVSRLSKTELQYELADSKRYLEEKLDCRVDDFAYPFGKISDCGPLSAELLPRLAYRSGVTTVAGRNRSDGNPFELRRLQVGADSSLARFAFELARAFLEPENREVADKVQVRAVSDTKPLGSNGPGAAFRGSDA